MLGLLVFLEKEILRHEKNNKEKQRNYINRVT